jgi:hypothetical protein
MALRRERARHEGETVSRILTNPSCPQISRVEEQAPDQSIRFDSSIGRGDIITPIGVGRVIPGA